MADVFPVDHRPVMGAGQHGSDSICYICSKRSCCAAADDHQVFMVTFMLQGSVCVIDVFQLNITELDCILEAGNQQLS